MASRTGGDAGAPLKGPERVAALLLAMGKPVAERILPHFEPAELKQISRSAVGLGAIPPAKMELLIEEFAGQFSAGLNLLGSQREIEKLLSGVIPPEEIAALMSDQPEPPPAAPDQSVWERLADLPDGILAGHLQNEHPQTVALVLSKLDPGCAAKMMGAIPAALRDGAMRRMLSSTPPPEAALRLLAQSLQEDLLTKSSTGGSAERQARLAKIINKMDQDHADSALNSLTGARPEEAEALKGLLFKFDDLLRLSPEARTALLDEVPTERVVLALQDAEAEITEAVLSALTSRARRIVENELKSDSPVAQRDVIDARRQIADTALEMSARGDIDLTAPTEEDAV